MVNWDVSEVEMPISSQFKVKFPKLRCGEFSNLSYVMLQQQNFCFIFKNKIKLQTDSENQEICKLCVQRHKKRTNI